MAKSKISDKTQEFSRFHVQGTPLLIRWWKGAPVMVLVPPTPILVREDQGRPITLICKIPVGAMRVFPLTEERKKFLIGKGMNPELIEKGLVFEVSEALASKFNKEREATDALAAKLGFSGEDLGRIVEAKRQLAKFQPSNRLERIAKRGLETVFSYPPSKKEAGRPSRISAQERQELRTRAREMLGAGKTRREIESQFAEEYELGLSYVRRIIEDNPKLKEQNTTDEK